MKRESSFKPMSFAQSIIAATGRNSSQVSLGTVLKLNPILLTIKTYRYTIAISTLKKDLLWLIRMTMLMR